MALHGCQRNTVPRSCTAFTKTTVDLCQKIRLKTVEWKERAPAKERSRAQRKARPNHKRRNARTKERSLERASKRKVSPPKERERAKAKTRKVAQVENPTKIGKVHALRHFQPYKRTRYIRCFDHSAAGAGMSCLYSCHQWHRVEEAVYFWLPTSRSVCKLNSRQAPCFPWPVGCGILHRWRPSSVASRGPCSSWSLERHVLHF